MSFRLPPPPDTGIRVVEDYTDRARCNEGFIRLRRQRLSARFSDGSVSEPFDYDDVLRADLDAVVIVPHFMDESGATNVFLRSAVRPPVAMRSPDIWPVPERPTLGHLWEVPAGLVEANERSEQGLRACAARELAEELGFHLTADDMLPLGPPTFPAPAIIGERHFYFHCVVVPSTRRTPKGDGSPLEQGATVIVMPLDVALDLTRKGEIEDAKTEIALRRLRETLR